MLAIPKSRIFARSPGASGSETIITLSGLRSASLNWQPPLVLAVSTRAAQASPASLRTLCDGNVLNTLYLSIRTHANTTPKTMLAFSGF